MDKHYKGLLLLLCVILVIASCRRSLDTGWDTRYLTPIVTGELTIYDLVPDTLTQFEDDESVTLVYKSELQEAIEIPDTAVEVYVSLDSLTLEDQEMEVSISLGQIAIDLGFPIGTLIILSNGDSAVLAPLTGLSTDPTPIDATSFFETATFSQGSLSVSLANGLPVDLDTVVLKLTNFTDGALIMQDTFFLVPATGVPVVITKNLAGMTVEGNMIAEILNFNTPGSGEDSVFIDTSDALFIQFTAFDMELLEATAVFPEQNLINSANDVEYDMGGPEFTMMGIESGHVVVYVVNSINDTIEIVYDIPGAIGPDGSSVHIVSKVAPNDTLDEPFDLHGYTIDLRGSSGKYFFSGIKCEY